MDMKKKEWILVFGVILLSCCLIAPITSESRSATRTSRRRKRHISISVSAAVSITAAVIRSGLSP